jgi:hypothetical protein
MTVFISSDAEEDLVNGYWFYERQSLGLGDYFRSCLIADIDSLAYYGGIHACKYGPPAVIKTLPVLHLLPHQWKHHHRHGRPRCQA